MPQKALEVPDQEDPRPNQEVGAGGALTDPNAAPAATANTIEGIRDALWEQLVHRARLVNRRRQWLGGEFPRPDVQNVYELHVFDRFAEISRGNFLPTIVDIFADRLRVDSIRDVRTGRHDIETWDVFSAARARRDVHQAIADSVALGWGHLLVLPHRRRYGQATTRSLAPEHTITEAWADDPAEARFALTLTKNTEGRDAVRVYTAETVTTWEAVNADATHMEPGALSAWTKVSSQQHGLGAVPVITLGEGHTFIERGVIHQARANQSSAHGLAIERAQSFRKLIVNGYELSYDDDGNPQDPGLSLAPDKIGYLPPNEDASSASLWESSVTTGAAIEGSVQHALTLLAAACQVPPHYVFPAAGASVSGDVLKVSESVFRARLQALADQYGEQLDVMLGVLRAAAGLPPKRVTAVFNLVLPADASLAGDTVIKLVQAGMPLAKALVQAGAAAPAEAEGMADLAGEKTLLDFLKTADPEPTSAVSETDE